MSDIPRYGQPGFNLPEGATAPIKRPVQPEPELPLPDDIPRYGQPGFTLPETSRPTARLRSFDPEIFREALRQSPNPTEDGAKIAASIQMASRLDMDPSVVLNNFDQVAEQYLGAKAVPMSVLQALGSSWAGGNWTAERNKLGAELMRRTRAGGDPADILAKIEAHEAKKPPMDLTPRSLPLSALKWALESTAGFYEPMAWSAIAGVVLGPAGLGGLAATGIPEGTVAAARIASMGKFAAGYASTYESMAGAEMLELYNLKDKDGNRIQPRAAVAGAAVYGLLGGLSEYSQIAGLLPGGSTMVGTIVKKVAGRLFGAGNKIAEVSMRTAAKAAGGYLGNVTSEAAEEAIQQSLQIGIEEFLKEAANQNGAAFDLKPLEQSLKEVATAFGQAWAASTIMVAPGTVAEMAAAPAQVKQTVKAEAQQERIQKLAAMADDTRPPEERAAAIDARVQELTTLQREIAPIVAGLEAAKEWTPDLDKAIGEFRDNQNELAALQLLKNEEEAKNPDAPWRKTAEEIRRPKPVAAPATGLMGMPRTSLVPEVEQAVASESEFRTIVKELSPQMPDQQVEAVGLLASALAYAQDLTFAEWMDKHFVPEVGRYVELPEGKRGAILFVNESQALIEITARSDFSTWAHEMFHAVFRNLPAERTAPMAQWAGALKDDGAITWDVESQEKLTQAWIKYLQEGQAPTPELKTLFQRMAQWLVKAWEVISGTWQINDDIRQWMATLLTRPESGVGQATQGTPAEVQPQAQAARAEVMATEELELFQEQDHPGWQTRGPAELRSIARNRQAEAGARLLRTQAAAERQAMRQDVGVDIEGVNRFLAGPQGGAILYQTDPRERPDLAKDVEALRSLIDRTEERIRKLQSENYSHDMLGRMYAETGHLPEFIDRLSRTISALKRMTEKGVMLRQAEDPSHFNIIHRSTKPEDGIGNWRISAFDEEGPTGHRVGALDQLLEEQISGNWEVVEYKGEPILPEADRSRRTVIRPDILYQPEEIVDAIKETEWFSRFANVYGDRQSGQKASGMDVPMPDDALPLGVWMVDDAVKLDTGRMVSQLREVNVADLLPGEQTGPERMPYVNAYTEWANQNKVPPPIMVVETDQGSVMIINGHRRWLAAKAAGKTTIRAWVSPREDSGLKDSNGNPIWRAMTDTALAEKHGIRLNVRPMAQRLYQPEGEDALSRAAIKYFGTTEDPGEAGYILTDGQMLDFSGRHEASEDAGRWLSGRNIDHRQLMGEKGWLNNPRIKLKGKDPGSNSQPMRDFMARSKAVRFDANAGVAESMGTPSPRQITQIARSLEGRENVTLEIVDRDGYTLRQQEFDAPSSAEIRRFYADEGREGNVLYQPSAEQWYLRSQRTIETKMAGPMPGRQILKMLQNAGIKEDELRWTGLSTYLDTDERRSPQAVLEQIQTEAPVLDEIQKAKEWKGLGEQPLFDRYTMPGGQNYRELLLRLDRPEEDTFTLARRMFRRPYAELTPEERGQVQSELFNPTTSTPYIGPHWEESNVLVHARFNERLDSEGRKVLFIEEIQSDWHQQGREKGYSRPRTVKTIEDLGTKWRVTYNEDESSTEIGKALTGESEASARRYIERRIAEETVGVPDAPFKKTWHELMFRRMLRWATENQFDVLAWTTGEQQAERYDLSKQIDAIAYTKESDGTYGVEALKDAKVVIEQQHQPPEKLRELLGKEIAEKIVADQGTERERESMTQLRVRGEAVEFFEKEPGRGWLTRYANGETMGSWLSRQDAVNDAARLHEMLISGPRKELYGLDLKVGGEGMKGFYDKILVDYAKKYGKQWGAKVGETDIGKSTGMNPRFQDLAHSLDITPQMRESVLEGQTLFQPDADPHQAEILEGISKGMPVPDRVLDQYRDNPLVAAEITRRQLMIDYARRSASLDEFTVWMMQANSATPATEAYYKLIYETAQKTPEEPAITAERFISALDSGTIRDIFAEIQFIEGDNPESAFMLSLTPEMRELGKAALTPTTLDPDLVEKVRTQIAGNAEHWRSVLKDNLPESLKSTIGQSIANKETDADAPTDFRPITARTANMRFMKLMEAEGGVEAFLGDLYHEQNLGARAKGKRGGENLPVAIKVAASKAQRGVPFDPATRKAVLRELRNDATGWRSSYASLYEDREMMMQLDWENENADEAEDIRLRKENSRLRDQVKKLRDAGQDPVDLSNRKIADLEALVKDKDAALVDATMKVAKSREALEAVEQKLSDRERKEAQAEMGREPDPDASPLVKAYRLRAERLEEQVAFMRQAQHQALIARANSERAQKLTAYIMKPPDTGIADSQARQIEDIQTRLQWSPDDADPAMLSRIKEWRRQNPTAELPPDLVREIERRQPREMTLAELEDIAVQIQTLRHDGRAKRDEKLQLEREMVEMEREKFQAVIRGGDASREIVGLGTVGARRELKTPKLKQIYWGTLRMNRIALMLDGGTPGPYTKWLTDAVNDATDAQLNAVHKVMDLQAAKLEELKLTPQMLGKSEQYPGRAFTHAEMIGVYIYAQFEKGLFSLEVDNRIHPDTIKKIVTALSKEEKAYGDWMIDTLSTDEHFDRMEAVHLDFNNQRMVREDRYFPFQRRELGSSAFMAEIADYLLQMRGLPRRRGAPGFFKSRMDRYPGQVFPALRLDAPVIFNDYVEKSEWFIANAILVKRLNRFFNPQLGGKPVRGAILEKHGDAMLELIDKYIGAYENPNIYRSIDDWGGLARLMRSNVSVSLLGFNLMTILRQIPDIPQIMVQAGPLDALNAAARLLASPRETMALIHEKAPQLRQRSYDRLTEELKLLDRNGYEKFMRSVGSAGFVALQALDTVANSIGWLAIYNKTMRETGNDITASKAARDFILTHRPAARAKDLAQFYRDPGLASWFLMFTNQQNQQWNILTFDIPHKIKAGLAGNTKELVSAVMEAAALMIGAVGMAIVARKRLPEGEEYPKDILAWIFGNAPFVGNDIEGAIRGQGNYRGAIYPIGGAYDIAKAVTGIAEGQDMEKATRSAMNALWELARTSGLPIVQAKRMMETFHTGDPWELIGGPPKAAGE